MPISCIPNKNNPRNNEKPYPLPLSAASGPRNNPIERAKKRYGNPNNRKLIEFSKGMLSPKNGIKNSMEIMVNNKSDPNRPNVNLIERKVSLLIG